MLPSSRFLIHQTPKTISQTSTSVNSAARNSRGVQRLLSMDAHKLYSYQTNPSSASHSAPNYTVSNLPRITGPDLRAHILSEHPSLAIIDVRDSDYIGGHIKGCQNEPSPNLDWRMPELVRTLKDKEIVVFHCALSQIRGPSAALRYLREKQRLGTTQQGNEVAKCEEQSTQPQQKVYVLDGGFVKWQEKYGEDARLTEAYQKDIWQYGY